MNHQEMIERLREWAKEIRAGEDLIYPEVDLDGLQYDLDHIAAALEEKSWPCIESHFATPTSTSS
jgi:hypothetical protein